MLSNSIQPATYFLLIRHGENEWVDKGLLAGRTSGVHLNEKGRQQAAGLVEHLQRQPIHAIYSSPLERCLETAQPLAHARGLPIVVEDGLVEVDYGEWMGGELKELGKRPEWHAVQHHPSTFRFPGGESLREVQYRAIGVLERLSAAHSHQVVALFSHGDVIRTLTAHCAGTALDLFQRIHISTGSITVVAQFGDRPALLNMNVLPEPAVFEFKASEEQQASQESQMSSK
jgi:probable phosphoglycerate mutase